MALTENTTLDEVVHDPIGNTLRVTWRDHIYRDGEEIDSARVARVKTYAIPADAAAFDADLGDDAAKYAALFE